MIKDRFSRNVFLVAGIYGLIVLLPGYFGEKALAQKMPPAVTHPEFFYGFFGVAVAWQVAFLIIARDPQRFRPIIPAAILEKLTYCVACAVLFILGRIPVIVALGGAGDFVLGTLFTISYFRLRPAQGRLIKGDHHCRRTLISPLGYRRRATCPRSLTNFLAA
jgi:hypothetical protein